jgi:aryl-alcohol dehydrogenase-like predicted oxidoreductase
MSAMRVKRRILGRTGLSVPEIGFGCGPTADLMVSGDAATRRAAVARALELGIDYFDTAALYGEGASELHLGQTLRELGAEPLIATKVSIAAHEMGDIVGTVISSVEASLERLGQASIPLIQLHNRVGPKRAYKGDLGSGALLAVEDVLCPAGVIEAFRELRRRGLVQVFGCSAFGGDMAAVARLIASDAFDCLMLNYSALNRTAFEPPRPGTAPRNYSLIGARAAAAGMGVIGVRVLEAGLLTDAPLAPTARRTPEHELLARQAAELRDAAPRGAPLAETALRFGLSNPHIAITLVGFSDIGQIDAAAAAADAGPLPGPFQADQ